MVDPSGEHFRQRLAKRAEQEDRRRKMEADALERLADMAKEWVQS